MTRAAGLLAATIHGVSVFAAPPAKKSQTANEGIEPPSPK